MKLLPAFLCLKYRYLPSTGNYLLNSELFKGYKNISFEVDGALHKYMIGANEDYYEILRLKEELKQEFPEAFIVAFKNGQRMNTGEAVKEFVKNKRKAM